MSDVEEKQKSSQDTAWKDILETLFPDFVCYCFPELYEQINWEERWEFLDKELHAMTKDSMVGNRFVDKLIRVKLKNGET
ncbi:MAG: hypothetical protein JSS53_03530, partial [Proteobacteria bacterium]|nr:hypothetical protein [Pseudomonadota bacterium]